MIPRFQGAPTRTGRVILAVFGAPFMLAAAWLFGQVVLGDEAAGGKVAMVIGGVVFVGAGCFLWAPAFPGIVNRVLMSDSRIVRALRPGFPALAIGGLITAMGLVPVLAAVGIIPTDDSLWQAPRWVGAVAGGLFVVAGLFVSTQRVVARLEPRLQKQVQGLFPLVIFSGFAVIATWVAFGPGERQFSGSVGNSLMSMSGGGGELAGRIAFGAGAIFLIVASVIGWWKYLTGRW